MLISRYISSISKHFQNFSDRSLPQLRPKLQGISSSLDGIIEVNRMLNGIIPARLLESARNIERRLEGQVGRLELKTNEIGDNIEDLEREFCGGLHDISWLTIAIIGRMFGFIGTLFGLNEPGFGFIKLQIKLKRLKKHVVELGKATEELTADISELQQAIDLLHAQVFQLAMLGSLTSRVERSYENDTRGRD